MFSGRHFDRSAILLCTLAPGVRSKAQGANLRERDRLYMSPVEFEEKVVLA